MRAIWITKYGGPEVLEVREQARPRPAAWRSANSRARLGPQLRRAHGARGAVPRRAEAALRGRATRRPESSTRLAAGVTEPRDRGARSSRSRVSAVTPRRSAFRFPGTRHARRDVLRRGRRAPRRLRDGLPLLFRVAPLRPGARVLIHMAAGGVGLAALQLCRTVPGVVVFGTASAAKHASCASKGATTLIDYRTTDYATEVKRMASGHGLDLGARSARRRRLEEGLRPAWRRRDAGRLRVREHVEWARSATSSTWR